MPISEFHSTSLNLWLKLTRSWHTCTAGCSAGGQALEKAAKEGFAKSGEDAGRRDVNEAFFLHGLPKEFLGDVLRTGFNERYSGANAGSLFGARDCALCSISLMCSSSFVLNSFGSIVVATSGDGSYFAQDIEKADQYTRTGDSVHGEADAHRDLYPGGASEHPGDDYGGVCYVLVTRVALGYTLRTKGRFFDPETRQFTKQCVAMDPGATESGLTFIPSCRDLVNLPQPFGASGVKYHSLLAEVTKNGGSGTIQRFREFVTFNAAYTYP